MMTLTITIKGNGTVDKVVDGNTTTLTAIPSKGWNFKHFMIGSDEIKDNPCSFDAASYEEVFATFYMSIASYLKGKVGFEVPDETIDSILSDREIGATADIDDLTRKIKDLLYADVLMYGTTLTSSYTGQKESDGGWTSTGGSYSNSEGSKKRYYYDAQEIYAKYNDPRKARAKIKILNLNGTYRR